MVCRLRISCLQKICMDKYTHGTVLLQEPGYSTFMQNNYLKHTT